MSSVINQIKVGTVEYALAHSAVAVCSCDTTDQAKLNGIIVTDDPENSSSAHEFTAVAGVCVTAFFPNGNPTANPTLNIEGTGYYPIILVNYNSNPSKPTANYLIAGVPYLLFFNGAAWQLFSGQPAVTIKTWGASD
jgi:hypothetical protein